MKKYFSWTMILCMVFISTVNVSAELDSIQNMLDELNGTEEKDDGTASEETGTEPSELDFNFLCQINIFMGKNMKKIVY